MASSKTPAKPTLEVLTTQISGRPEDKAVASVSRKPVTLPGVAKRIVALLDANPEDAWTHRGMEQALQVPKGSLRMPLSRLAKSGLVVRVSYGLYQSPSGLARPNLPDPNLRIHALKVEARYTSMGRSYLELYRRIATVWPSPALHRHSKNRSVTSTAEWEGRLMTVTLHQEDSGLIEIFVKSSEKPLNLIETYSYLSGTIVTGTGIPPEFWVIKQADWNIDKPVRISTDISFTSLSIAGFGKLVVKVYQRALTSTRVEVRSFDQLGTNALLRVLEDIFASLETLKVLPKGVTRNVA